MTEDRFGGWAVGSRTHSTLKRTLSGAVSVGPCIGHVAPEAATGGAIAFVQDGDRIRLDIPARRLELLVDEGELAARRASMPLKKKEVTGVLARYIRLVGSVAEGARLNRLD